MCASKSPGMWKILPLAKHSLGNMLCISAFLVHMLEMYSEAAPDFLKWYILCNIQTAYRVHLEQCKRPKSSMLVRLGTMTNWRSSRAFYTDSIGNLYLNFAYMNLVQVIINNASVNL